MLLTYSKVILMTNKGTNTLIQLLNCLLSIVETIYRVKLINIIKWKRLIRFKTNQFNFLGAKQNTSFFLLHTSIKKNPVHRRDSKEALTNYSVFHLFIKIKAVRKNIRSTLGDKRLHFDFLLITFKKQCSSFSLQPG